MSPAMQWIDKIIKNLHPSATFKGTVDISCVQNVQQIHVIGIGKASCAQVDVCVQMLSAQTKIPIHAFAFTKNKHGYTSNNFSYFESAHPVSNESCIDAADKLIEILNNTGANDLVIVCLSGGASALVWKPFDEWSLQEIQQLTKELLSQNISIDKMNKIRRQFCQIKNGGFASHCTASTIIELITSDVDSGDLAAVGSGPLHFEKTNANFNDVKPSNVIEKFKQFCVSEKKISWDKKVQQSLQQKNITIIPVSSPETLKQVALQVLTDEGYQVFDISDPVKADSLEQGVEKHLEEIRKIKVTKKTAIFSVGEYTVELPNNPPPGGRNLHFALLLGHRLNNPKAEVYSFGSDGTDGTTQAAGGTTSKAVFDKARELTLSAEEAINTHSAFAFLQSTGGLITTGPTQTNLLDLRVILLAP